MENITIFKEIPNLTKYRLAGEEKEKLYCEDNIDNDNPLSHDKMVDVRDYRV